MKITVTLELDNPYDLDAEEIKKDIRMAEDQIGWNYDYKIISIDVDQKTQSSPDMDCPAKLFGCSWCSYRNYCEKKVVKPE